VEREAKKCKKGPCRFLGGWGGTRSTAETTKERGSKTKPQETRATWLLQTVKEEETILRGKQGDLAKNPA